MSQRYTDLIEKLERQNGYSMKDKLEVQYLLRDISQKTHGMLSRNNKVLKLVVALQLAQLSADNIHLIIPLLKVLL